MESPQGLTSDEVLDRVAKNLVNTVDDQSSRSLLHIVRANVFTRFNAILGALFLIIVTTGSLADGLFGAVVLANTILGAGQEWRAKRTLDKIRLLHGATSTVIRHGSPINISFTDIVQDDVISLRSGDQIPVDGHVLMSQNLEVNEANLTGEADAVHKDAGHTVFSGTFVTAGDGLIVATSVGHSAYAQRLTREAKIFAPPSSEIHQSINRVLLWALWSIALLAPLQLWSQLRVYDAENWREATTRSIAGLVGVIPEGLVVLTTLTFLTAAVQLSRQHVLVQQLPAVETLARVNVVCIDKTGTITTGMMKCSAVDFSPDFDRELSIQVLAQLAHDPAANATLRAIGARFSPALIFEQTASIPFDSQRKWKAVQLRDGDVDLGSWFLGAPELLMPNDRDLQNTVLKKAQQGQRVLLLGHSTQPLDGLCTPSNLVSAALISIEEEIRHDAADTISYFHQQNVDVYVLSGDHPVTVSAIARKIGIADDRVFGRVTPEQKREFVQTLHQNNNVVAMTGDGVNDVLALKSADIGIAMDNAAPATKAVAELILLDGKFSHLPSVIGEGRRVIGNVERVAHVFLTKNIMSVVSILSVALLARQFPFLPRQMTLVSSLAIGIPAFFLAIGKTSPRYVPGLLHRVLVFAIPAGFITGVGVVATDLVVDTSEGTAASIVALCAFLWIISIFARPFSLPRVVLLISMASAAVVAFATPSIASFFELSQEFNVIIFGLIGGLCTGVLIEVAHRRWH